MEDGDHFVRLRGLPWTATAKEVAAFLEGCNIVDGAESGVHFTRNPDGRASGEAFVHLVSEDDVKQAVSKNKEHMGKRYIDVFKVKRSEMDWVFKHGGGGGMGGGGGPYDSAPSDAVVRLRGLPFGCSKEEIANFFTGLEIVPNGITILTDGLGRTTGDAFVQFAHTDLVEKALLKHKETIGHRYVEIFASNWDELMGNMQRIGGMRGPRGGMGGPGGRPGPFNYGGFMGGGMPGGPMGCMGGPPGGGMGGPQGFCGRGGRFNPRGFHDEEFDRFGGGGGMGYGGGMGFGGTAGAIPTGGGPACAEGAWAGTCGAVWGSTRAWGVPGAGACGGEAW